MRVCAIEASSKPVTETGQENARWLSSLTSSHTNSVQIASENKAVQRVARAATFGYNLKKCKQSEPFDVSCRRCHISHPKRQELTLLNTLQKMMDVTVGRQPLLCAKQQRQFCTKLALCAIADTDLALCAVASGWVP